MNRPNLMKRAIKYIKDKSQYHKSVESKIYKYINLYYQNLNQFLFNNNT